MQEQILRTLRRQSRDHQFYGLIREEAATSIVNYLLGKNDVGYFHVTMPPDHGLFVQYHADFAEETKLQSFADPVVVTPGVLQPMRNRYLGAPDDMFFDVEVGADYANEGTELTNVTYAALFQAGTETDVSWFYIPAGLTIMFKFTSLKANNIVVCRVNAGLVSPVYGPVLE
ncbi:MAG: hypothetical protein GY753_11835 [Gammaproteobacteria bacterium]|nr:hypothetical protein [Gammaproteobacteria bacterium]